MNALMAFPGSLCPPFLALLGNGRAQRPRTTIHGEKLVTKTLHTRYQMVNSDI